MTGDPIERLRHADPAGDGTRAAPYEDALAYVRRRAGRPSGRVRWPGGRKGWLGPVGMAATVAVVVVVVFLADGRFSLQTRRGNTAVPARAAALPSPGTLLPAAGGMRGTVFGVSVVGAGSALRVSFAQCTNCAAHQSSAAERVVNWSTSSTDGGRRWDTVHDPRAMFSPGLFHPEGQDVWQFGYRMRRDDPSFFVSHDGGATFRPADAPDDSDFTPITLGGGEVWTLGTRCVDYQCASAVLTGAASGSRLKSAPAQPPGMPQRHAPSGLLVAGYGARGYVSQAGVRHLFTTEDGGRVWAPVAYPCPTRTVVENLSVASDRAVWITCGPARRAGGTSGPQARVVVRRSSDGGRYWRTMRSDLGVGVQLVAVSPLVAWEESSDGQLSRTSDGGASWSTVLPGHGLWPAVTVQSASDATVVYTVTAGGRSSPTRRTDLVVYRTTSAGARWSHTVIGLPRG